MRKEIRIENFSKFYPSRAAARKLRDRDFFGLEAVKQLRRFFHNRQVGAEVRIEYVIAAKSPQGRNHLAFDEGTRLHAEGFAESDADGRSGLENNDFIGILDCCFYFFYVVYFRNSVKGAGRSALTAMDANRHIARTCQTVIVHDALRVGAGSAAQCAIFALSFVKLNGTVVFINGNAPLKFFESGTEYRHLFLLFVKNIYMQTM